MRNDVSFRTIVINGELKITRIPYHVGFGPLRDTNLKELRRMIWTRVYFSVGPNFVSTLR
jgi:hypothetical protein